jgi:hypothetical protein
MKNENNEISLSPEIIAQVNFEEKINKVEKALKMSEDKIIADIIKSLLLEENNKTKH